MTGVSEASAPISANPEDNLAKVAIVFRVAMSLGNIFKLKALIEQRF